MGKDLKGKELGTGLRQRKDGRYEARAKINGIDINLYDVDLKKLKILFEKAKEEARNNIDMKRQKITLNEWFEEWFANYKIPNIKETSVFPMRSKYYNTFGKAIGNMKVTDIRNLDIQRVINDMNKQGRASSSMRDALGRVRECLESAKNNRIIDINPCFEINVPWENKTAERRFLSMAEQTSVYKGYKRDKIEMRVDRVEVSDFPLYLNTVAGGLDRRDQTIGGFSFVVKIYAVPVIEIIG